MFDNTKKHVIAESSLLKATRTGRIVNLIADEDVDNGKLVTKEGYVKPEVYTMGTPEKGSEVYLTLQVPLIYEAYTSLDQAEYNFYNAKGECVRCYPLEKNDIFTVSEIGIAAADESPVVGNLVVADGKDIKEVDPATDTSEYGFVGKIIEKVGGTIVKYRIEVIKNTEV